MKLAMWLWWLIRNVAAEMKDPWLVGSAAAVGVVLRLLGWLL
jgi:hypothetical protein